jgi:hypothetical protein
VVDACGVVVAAAGGVGERIIGVVYLLEFAGALGAFGGVGGYAVGVGAEGRSGGMLEYLIEILDR